MDAAFLSKPNLKSRGWTDSLIRDFLEQPDETRPNPSYRNAGNPMSFYKRERVEMIEITPEFLQAKKLADERKSNAKKGVTTKLQKIREYVENLVIDVPYLEHELLVQTANKELRTLPHEIDMIFDERMCVNFLRHRMTKYESELSKIAGKTGGRGAYYDIKEKVLEAIAEKYDWLEEECWRLREKLEDQRMNELP